MRILCLALMLLCCGSFSIAQSVLGRVATADGLAVDYANIAVLKRADSSFVAGSAPDSAGRFSVPLPGAGPYILRITAVGMKSFIAAVPEGGGYMGELTLLPEATVLKDVTVTSLRPTIVQKADRLEVTIEGTTAAAGNTAFSLLSKIPGVFIDPEGNIRLNGKSGVVMMMDGRRTYMSARDLRTWLESISAENIRSVELITNPSASFDAEGTGGVININFKKATNKGLTGSVHTNYSYNFKQHMYGIGGNFYYMKGKFTSFLTADFARRAWGREATFTRVFYQGTNPTYFDQTALGNGHVIGPPFLRFGTDYAMNSRHSIGVIVMYGRNSSQNEFLTDTYMGPGRETYSQFVEANNYFSNKMRNLTANLHYTWKIDTSGRQLSTEADYIHITNKGEGDLISNFTDLATSTITRDDLFTTSASGFDIYSARLDYKHPLSRKRQVEAGLRGSRVVSDNDFGFYFNNGSLVPDVLRSNHFFYKEHIMTGYANWNSKLGSKLSLQAGLRGEYTLSRGESFTTGRVTDRSYFNAFPSIFLQQTATPNWSINYSYLRRITRPNYGDLNPFRAYRDPYTWYEGNPLLRPQYTNSFSIAQTFKSKYIITLSYQQNMDVMAEIPILDVASNTTIYTTGNIDDAHNADMTAIIPVKFFKWWESQNTGTLSFSRFKSVSSGNGQLLNERFSYGLRSEHTILLPLDIRAELSIAYQGPEAYGLYVIHAMSRVDIGLQKSFLNKKLQLVVNANDIFKGYWYKFTTDINNNVNDFNQYFRFRSIGLTLRYNFSKGLKVDERQHTNIEEAGRAN
jgi:hypothetical protein